MAKPSAVPQDLVFTIAAELLARDENPTTASVQQELTRRIGAPGGTAVVSRMVSAWRADAAAKLSPNRRVRPDTPEVIVALADQLADQMHVFAFEQARASFEKDREALEEERAAMTAEVEQVKTHAAEVAAQLQEAQGRLEREQALLTEEKTRTAGLASKVDMLVEREAELRAQLAELSERNEAKGREIAQIQSEHARQSSEAEARHAASLEAERKVWQGERQHLHEQTDRLRQASKQREDDLTRQLKAQEALADQYRTQAMDARQSAGKYQGQAEASAAMVATLQKQVQELTEQKIRLEASVAELSKPHPPQEVDGAPPPAGELAKGPEQ